MNWNANEYGLFQPCRIIQKPNVPSKNMSSGKQTVVLMYQLNVSPDAATWFNFTTPSLRTLLGWYCGPSVDNSFPVGAHLRGCCAHVMTAIGLGFCLAHNPRLHKPVHHTTNLVDIRPREQDVRSR